VCGTRTLDCRHGLRGPVTTRVETSMVTAAVMASSGKLPPRGILFGSAIHDWKFKADIALRKRSAVYWQVGSQTASLQGVLRFICVCPSVAAGMTLINRSQHICDKRAYHLLLLTKFWPTFIHYHVSRGTRRSSSSKQFYANSQCDLITYSWSYYRW